MPFYQFIVPAGSPTLEHKAEIAAVRPRSTPR